MEELAKKFKYWNDRGKCAICRYVLEQLGITAEEFVEYTKGWEEIKLIKTEKGYDAKIEPIYIKKNGRIVRRE